jgi:NAD(P)-dependent dehydrogenase (short-subunit alcohol dehydrogenase family)
LPTTGGISRKTSGRSVHGELHRTRRDRNGPDHGNRHSWQHSGKSDRSELVALWRVGTVENCAEVIEFLATNLPDYVTGAGIPVDGGLMRG